METAEVVDYAYPTMMAEKALKDMHGLVLDGDLFAARQQVLQAIRWAVEAHTALKVMEQKGKRV